MLTVAIVSQKGGVGKTTLSIHLAVAAHLAGLASVIVDADPQASASRWAKWRRGGDPDVLDCASHILLPDKLGALARAGADIAFIDTPPAADIMAREACRAGDLLLVPCRPRILDLDAIRTTADLAFASGKPAFVVFMASPVRGELLLAEARAMVRDIGLEIAPGVLSERAAFHHSIALGKSASETEPKGKAAEEVNLLWRWLISHARSLTPKVARELAQ